MNRRLLWIGIGCVFALAVGSGYLPDLMLARELSAARAEGLLRPMERKVVPVAQDARPLYQEAIRTNTTGIQALRSNPKEIAKPTGYTRLLLRAVAKASRRPLYSLPNAPAGDDPSYRQVFPALEPDLELAARSLAATAVDEEGLLAAARVGGHLQSADPAGIPMASWATVAGAALDGADRLKLPADGRARVVAALGPRPDPVLLVRRHVMAVLARVESGSKRTAGLTRRVARFLSTWRRFLRTVPSDPQVFAQAVKSAESELNAADDGVGIGDMIPYYGYSSQPEWGKWAAAMAKTLIRLDRESGRR